MTVSPKRPEAATPLPAILYVFASGVMFSCLDTAAKYLVVSGLSPVFVSWMRFTMHVLFGLLLLKAWANPALFRAASLPMHFLRGLTLFGSTIFNFAALKWLQLAETTSIAFFAPMVITALAGPLLGEWAGWRRWLAVGTGLVGVLVITRPGFGAFHFGHVFALCSMLSYCAYVMLTRHMVATESAESLIFYSALAPVILIAPTVPFTVSAPPTLFHGVLLVSLGLFGGVGHWCIIKAYRLATATALAPYPYLQMVWMIAWGYLVFGQLPDGWTIGGAAIIVASGLYIVHREHRLRVASRANPAGDAPDLAEKL